jgi:hypothetical protein
MACIGRGQLLPGRWDRRSARPIAPAAGRNCWRGLVRGPARKCGVAGRQRLPSPDQSRTSFARIIPALLIFAEKLGLEQVVGDDGRIDEMLGILGQGGNSKVTSREPK